MQSTVYTSLYVFCVTNNSLALLSLFTCLLQCVSTCGLYIYLLSMLQDWSYADGQSPPVDVLNKWLNLVKARYQKSSDSCIAVHCVAGLGR